MMTMVKEEAEAPRNRSSVETIAASYPQRLGQTSYRTSTTKSEAPARRESCPGMDKLAALAARRAFHERVLAEIREFLERHAMSGKRGAREFHEFEVTFHQRLREAQREIVDELMATSSLGWETTPAPTEPPQRG